MERIFALEVLGNNSGSYDYVQSRSALAGYMTGSGTQTVDSEIDDYYFTPTILTNVGNVYPHFYYRNNDVDASVGLKGVEYQLLLGQIVKVQIL